MDIFGLMTCTSGCPAPTITFVVWHLLFPYEKLKHLMFWEQRQAHSIRELVVTSMDCVGLKAFPRTKRFKYPSPSIYIASRAVH